MVTVAMFISDAQGQLVPGLLEYLADGVIPLFHTFYSHFFDPSSTHKEEQREMEYTVSAMIARSLTVMMSFCFHLLLFSI